jgi:energy-coupling factor transporter ATP-binding protein EcfA2
MGRAIVREPDAFLMDEPLSNLDAKLRVPMRAEIHQLQRRLKTTTLYVTHDQVEAMTMGDRVSVMNAGRLLQVDTRFRPEDFEDARLESGAPTDRRMKVEVELTEPLGADVLLYFGPTATGLVPSAASADVGEDASVHLGGNGDGFGGTRMCARVSPRTRIAIGHAAELAVDPSRLYFVDPSTRDAIEH